VTDQNSITHSGSDSDGIPATFTPGPWFTGQDDPSQVFVWSEFNEYPISIASCCFAFVARDPDATEANARLIAAAPELLSACQALVECFIKRGPWDEPLGSSEQAPSINAGVAAIAKALGQ
jgi:hypothetical protein